MVESQPSLTGFETTQCRHVDARSGGDLFEGEAALHPQISETLAHPQIDTFFGICLHGKKAWHFR